VAQLVQYGTFPLQKVPCVAKQISYLKFDLLMYINEFRLKSFVVLIIGNSMSIHLGAQGTFKR